MNSLIFRCVLFFTVLYLFVEVLECSYFKRHDIHRIILKTKNKDRFKKPRHLRQVSHYRHHSPKEIYLPNREKYEESNNPQFTPSNSFSLPRNRYKGYKYFQKERKPEVNKFQPQSDFEYSHVDDQFFRENSKYLVTPSGNDYVTTYHDYERHKGIVDSYNKRQEEEFQKQVTQAEKHAKQQYHWHGSDESLFQEENEDDSLDTSNSDKVQAIWQPSFNMESKHRQVTYNKNHNIGYIVDITTSKPQKLPMTIIEHKLINQTAFGHDITYNFGENISSNHKSTDDVLQNDEGAFREVPEQAFTPIMTTFHLENSYSTLPEQYTIGALKRKETKKNNHYSDKKNLKRIKRPAYSTINRSF